MVRTARRSSWAVLGCVAAALLLGACSSSAAPSSTGSSTNSGPPLVIGASMSLSGDFATLADPALKGYKLWAATVNKQSVDRSRSGTHSGPSFGLPMARVIFRSVERAGLITGSMP